jgi:signal transduction histidine kinase
MAVQKKLYFVMRLSKARLTMNMLTAVRYIFRILFICFLGLVQSHQIKAQVYRSGSDTILLSNIHLFRPITPETGLYVDSTNSIRYENLRHLPMLMEIPVSLSRKLNAKYVGKNIYLQFNVRNDTDSAKSIYFLPGFYFHSINLFRLNSKTDLYEPVLYETTENTDQRNVARKLNLSSGESASYISEIRFIKTTVNTLTPILVHEFYFPFLLNELQNQRKLNSIITYLICGIMLMMIFYSLAGYYMNRSIEFIYYAAYALLLGTMFFFKAYLFKKPIESNFFFESYFDFILQATGTLFYFAFLRCFIKAKRDFPLLNTVLFIQVVLTITGLVLFTYLNFFTDNFLLQNLTENLIKYDWSISTIFFIVYAAIKRSPILSYLAIGHSFLFLGGLLSLFLINTTHRFSISLSSLINDSLFWYEMGILFELVFFLVALSFKNKQDITVRAREKERMLMDHEKSLIERKMAILAAQQDERNRISADMHDELGSGVTAIRLMSELAKTKMKGQTLPEIDKISNSANDLITKMNAIIWTMKSSNDSVDNMIAYVRSYTLEFLDNTDISCHIEYPDSIPAIEMSGERRRNIFLCIKEALNNIVKHSKATEVMICFKLGPHLVIEIRDNGTGLNPDKLREFSNGLANMRKRMETIDGHFSIRNQHGTIVTLSVPLG